MKKTCVTLPLLCMLLPGFSESMFKLLRWLLAHWCRPTPLAQALLHLRRLYANFNPKIQRSI